MRIVVLISGSGSNLQAIIDNCENGNIHGEICAVISNRPHVKGLERAAAHNIETTTLDHKNYLDRATFDAALAECIHSYSPDLVVLAGFMRILTPEFTQQFLGHMINIHPSLLPKYPGLHTHQRAIDAGDTEHGVSVHFVTAELDGGPIIAQARVPIHPGDTETTLAARLLEQEHCLYPKVISWFCDNRLKLNGNTATLDGNLIDLNAHKR